MQGDHPFSRLPAELRRHPAVIDAWLMDLSSHPSSNDTLRPQVFPVSWARWGVVATCLGTISGVIKPEIGLKFLAMLLGLPL